MCQQPLDEARPSSEIKPQGPIHTLEPITRCPNCDPPRPASKDLLAAGEAQRAA